MSKTNKDLQEELNALKKEHKKLLLKLIKAEFLLNVRKEKIENLEWEYTNK